VDVRDNAAVGAAAAVELAAAVEAQGQSWAAFNGVRVTELLVGLLSVATWYCSVTLSPVAEAS
jgi:uncharacterized membrane protein